MKVNSIKEAYRLGDRIRLKYSFQLTAIDVGTGIAKIVVKHEEEGYNDVDYAYGAGTIEPSSNMLIEEILVPASAPFIGIGHPPYEDYAFPVGDPDGCTGPDGSTWKLTWSNKATNEVFAVNKGRKFIIFITRRFMIDGKFNLQPIEGGRDLIPMMCPRMNKAKLHRKMSSRISQMFEGKELVGRISEIYKITYQGNSPIGQLLTHLQISDFMLKRIRGNNIRILFTILLDNSFTEVVLPLNLVEHADEPAGRD